MSTTANLIQNDLYNADQSWFLDRIVVKTVQGTSHRLRVRIRRNAYDEQSYAVCERWDGTAWQQVVTRPIAAMAVGAKRDNGRGTLVNVVSYTQKQVNESLFDADADDLVARALKVVA